MHDLKDVINLAGPLVSHGYVLDTTPARLGRLEAVPAPEIKDYAALQRRIKQNGYLFLKGFFNPEKVAGFREYFFNKLAGTGLLKLGSPPVEGLAGDTPYDQLKAREILFNDIIKGPEYQNLCASPELREFFQGFLGGEVFLNKRKILRYIKYGSPEATGAHYDLVYLRQGTDQVYTAWIPLGDCAVQDGGLMYLENSHNFFQRMENDAIEKTPAEWITRDLPGLADKLNTRWLVTDYKAGDIVVHNAYMVHASLNNTNAKGRIRLSTDIRYQLASVPIDQRWQIHWHYDDGVNRPAKN
jgi:ectoine hydroxylase-related dioxygenase (phytanoyl-CoA dioxygenase family)